MKTTKCKRLLLFLVCAVLIAAMALSASGCNDNKGADSQASGVQSNAPTAEPTMRGEGAKLFYFTVTGTDGKDTAYEIHTDKFTVGEALLALGLIAGEDGTYGLYVKTVDGVTLDYNTDGKYWAFYENGAYAAKGVDSTEIAEGATYAFKAES